MSRTKISSELRQKIEQRDKGRCAYCQSQQQVVGLRYTIDHIVPQSLGGETQQGNLCLACWDCNIIKQARIGGVDPQTGEICGLFHPVSDQWEAHFVWEMDGETVSGITQIGRATVAALRLNRTELVLARQRWVQVGWHPPAD